MLQRRHLFGRLGAIRRSCRFGKNHCVRAL